eukprot:gnl/MRDRNA2_/MRDRNA2_143721_c0_seq1.p1 gnl/MRDRNA2_/MRDRNA2_143721_c0~~gnl/MRDRNA2_/MRDRNA2_143721_c0_seq1.p1  ORF type:complete len:513 (+),score=101.18 gnl/MRDRNA2_/MRDRNA2_143721_c0_seq1:83-1621(+)
MVHQDVAAGLAQNLVNVIAGTSIRGATTSITIADPGLPDCPLVACSEGFEKITGYPQDAIVGRNCRFLNEGCEVDEDVRFEMRKCVNFGTQFLCVLNNLTRQGMDFKNLLHMTTIRIGKRAFIVGIQCDVTHTDFNQHNKSHTLELQQVVDRIFAANLDAWVGQAASDFQASLPVPYSKILKDNYAAEYNSALNHFVSLEDDIASANEKIILISQKNTFIHAEQLGEDPIGKLKRSMSDSQIRPSFVGDISDVSTAASLREADSETASMCQQVNLLSVGSMGHGEGRCTPCKFFVDKNTGCAKGYDCRFCHEVHVKKAKKKRKAKADAQSVNITESQGGYPTSPPAKPAQEPQNIHVDDCLQVADQCALVYVPPSQSASQFQPGQMQNFNFAVGQNVMLPANLTRGQKDMKSMQQALTFSISPALPAGLTLNEKTGDITGTVQAPSGPGNHHSKHTVKVQIKIMAAGAGIPLGEVPLCEATIQIRLLDINVLLSQIKWIEAEGENALNLKVC